MCFDSKNLYLFNLLINKPEKSERIIELFCFDYSVKNPCSNENKIYKINITQVLKNYLKVIVPNKNKKLKTNKKFIKSYTEDEISSLSGEYALISEKVKEFSSKKPYSFFNPATPILNSKEASEIFMHIVLHMCYFLTFLQNKEIFDSHQPKPKIFSKFKFSKAVYVSKIQMLEILNVLFNFFTSNYKKHPIILTSLNEASIEVLANLTVLKYSLDNKIKSKFLFRAGESKVKVFQILMMLNSRNKTNKNYTYVISKILSEFVSNSYENLFSVVQLLDFSGLGEEKAREIMIKIYSPSALGKEYNFRKLIRNFIQGILTVKSKKNFFLTKFLVELLDQIFVMNDEEENYIEIFSLFFEEALKKFNVCIDKGNCRFVYTNHLYYRKITKEFIAFIDFIKTNFEMIIKKAFYKIVYVYDTAFIKVFDIVSLLNESNQNIYNNLEKDIAHARKSLIELLSMNFTFIDLDKGNIATKVYNYFSCNHFKKKLFYIEIDYFNEIKLKFIPLKNIIDKAAYYSTESFVSKNSNTIHNMLNLIYPFSNIEFQTAILKLIVEGEQLLDEKLISFPENIIVTKEDEEDFEKNIQIMNKNISYFETIIASEIATKFQSLDDSDLFYTNNPQEIILYLMKYCFDKRMGFMNELINCAKALLQAKANFFNLSYTIEYITFLKKIIDDKKYENDKTEIKVFINELIKHKEKEKDEKSLSHNSYDKLINDKIIEIKALKDKMNICYSIKQLISIFNISPNSKSSLNLSFETITNLFSFIKEYLVKFSNDNFSSNLIIKLSTYIFVSIKSDKNLREYYLKVYKETLNNFIMKNFIASNEKIIQRMLEILAKIIKKLKNKSFIIAINILKILFEIFENYAKDKHKSVAIESAIAIVGYLIEYSHAEISFYYSTIIKTAINYLKSNTSTIEQKRASGFLLYKILDKLEPQEIKDYSDDIFNAITVVSQASDCDKVLKFHLEQCLNFYE